MRMKRFTKAGTLHKLAHGRIAVMKHDPTEAVNYVGKEDEDFKYD